MSVEAGLRQEFDHWERLAAAVFTVLPYLLLTASAVFTLLQRDLAVHVPAVLGLTLVATVWIAWFHSLHPTRAWRENRPLMGLYYAGLTVLVAALVALAPSYGIFAFIGYVHAYECLNRRWRWVGAATTSMIMAVTYLGGLDRITQDDLWLWGAISLISTVLAGTFLHFAEAAERHGRKQQRALAELHQANVRLEAALTENAGLHAQLLVQAREAGVLDERQRIAREIHDTLAQGLAGIVTQLQAAEQTLDDPEAVRRHVTNAMNLARESLTEARRTVDAVGPELLAEARLPEAINDVIRRWSEVNHIDAVLATTGDPRPMHTDVEVTLLRTAQEALANLAKHAKAGRVGLTLSYMEDLVTLDVRDDGVGFEFEAGHAGGSANAGFGLAGMRQRVQRLAGRLDIESEPGGGTAISASLPAIPAGVSSDLAADSRRPPGGARRVAGHVQRRPALRRAR